MPLLLSDRIHNAMTVVRTAIVTALAAAVRLVTTAPPAGAQLTTMEVEGCVLSPCYRFDEQPSSEARLSLVSRYPSQQPTWFIERALFERTQAWPITHGATPRPSSKPLDRGQVPEPPAAGLLGAGLAALVAAGRRLRMTDHVDV